MKNIRKLILGLIFLSMGVFFCNALWAADEKHTLEDAIAAAGFFKKFNVQQIVLLHLKDATNRYDKLNVENDVANTVLVRELYLFYYGGYEKILVGVGIDARNKTAAEESDINKQFRALATYASMIDKGQIMNDEQFKNSMEHLSKLDLALHKYIQDLGL